MSLWHASTAPILIYVLFPIVAAAHAFAGNMGYRYMTVRQSAIGASFVFICAGAVSAVVWYART